MAKFNTLAVLWPRALYGCTDDQSGTQLLKENFAVPFLNPWKPQKFSPRTVIVLYSSTTPFQNMHYILKQVVSSIFRVLVHYVRPHREIRVFVPKKF